MEDEINSNMGQINGYQDQNSKAMASSFEVAETKEDEDDESVRDFYEAKVNEIVLPEKVNVTDQLSFRI